MATGRILHVGEGPCDQGFLLRKHGFEVQEITSLSSLLAALQNGPRAELICIREAPERSLERALSIARGLSKVPIVLFRSSQEDRRGSTCDLEVWLETPPEVWLPWIEDLLARMRTLNVYAAAMRDLTARLNEVRIPLRCQPILLAPPPRMAVRS